MLNKYRHILWELKIAFCLKDKFEYLAIQTLYLKLLVN